MVRRVSKLTDEDETERSEGSPRHNAAASSGRRAKVASSPSGGPQPSGRSPPQAYSSLLSHAAVNGDAQYGSVVEVKEQLDGLSSQQQLQPTASSPIFPQPEAHLVHVHSRPSSRSSSSPAVKPAAPPPSFSLSSDLHTFWSQLRSSPYLSSLLLCIPLALLSSVLSLPEALTFLMNFLSIIPLAYSLGMVTEEIALRTSQTVGALLNATFGNAVELIVSVVALRKGFIQLVQKSLLGSVLSNLLLVLGTSFLLGGLRYDQQSYNKKGAQVYASMLLLACLAVAVPSAYVNAFDAEVNIADVLDISRITAVIIFAIYLLYLYFQLITHTEIFSDEGGGGGAEEDGLEEEEERQDEEPLISLSSALILLLVITLLISFCSDALIDSIAPVCRAWSINESFIGIILLPIVGNAAEHATAVTCALKDKLDLSIGVAVGSSTQIALFVIPFVTLLAWGIGQPMTLGFSEFELVVLVMSVLIVNFLVKDGESNWLLGAMLVASYLILATAFWYHPVDAGENVHTISTALHKVVLRGEGEEAGDGRAGGTAG